MLLLDEPSLGLAPLVIRDIIRVLREIRAEGTRWVWDIQSRCQQLQRDLHDAIVSAETELDEVRTAFHRAQAHMEGVQDALSHLVSGTEETEKNHKG